LARHSPQRILISHIAGVRKGGGILPLPLE
jgi:hypothetical protein